MGSWTTMVGWSIARTIILGGLDRSRWTGIIQVNGNRSPMEARPLRFAWRGFGSIQVARCARSGFEIQDGGKASRCEMVFDISVEVLNL